MEYKYRGLVEPLLELPGMEEALKYLRKGKNIKITDIVNACKGHLGYSLSQFTNAPIVLITYDELSTKQLAEDLEVLKGKESVLIYPARDILFYSADVHSMDITAQRLKVMDALVNQKDVAVIIPIEALLNPLSPKETFEAYMQQIEVGGSIDLSKLEARLVQMGYERVARVEAMGQFSIRGGIIDIYGAASEEAYRIELWDDEVDSIRNFNIQTQRSVNQVLSFPAKSAAGLLRLFSYGSFNRARSCARTAVDAIVLVDFVLSVLFADSVNRTFCCTCTTTDASVCNYVCH